MCAKNPIPSLLLNSPQTSEQSQGRSVNMEKVNNISVHVLSSGESLSVFMRGRHLMLFLILPRLRSVGLLEDLGVFTTSARPLEMLRLAGTIWLAPIRHRRGSVWGFLIGPADTRWSQRFFFLNNLGESWAKGRETESAHWFCFLFVFFLTCRPPGVHLSCGGCRLLSEASSIMEEGCYDDGRL